jgi:regulator of nucleoside diphosphate kinase
MTAPRPPLLLRVRDERRLQAIALGAMLGAPRLAGGLLDELARAEVRPDAEVPSDVVGLGSRVLCLESDGRRLGRMRVQVVAPEEAEPRLGRISVLSDLGAALIGLSAGQSIHWDDRWGGRRRLEVLEVAT